VLARTIRHRSTRTGVSWWHLVPSWRCSGRLFLILNYCVILGLFFLSRPIYSLNCGDQWDLLYFLSKIFLFVSQKSGIWSRLLKPPNVTVPDSWTYRIRNTALVYFLAHASNLVARQGYERKPLILSSTEPAWGCMPNVQLGTEHTSTPANFLINLAPPSLTSRSQFCSWWSDWAWHRNAFITNYFTNLFTLQPLFTSFFP
jgi:hypothetical protein